MRTMSNGFYKSPVVYWHNRGYAEGFEGGREVPASAIPEKCRATYAAAYSQGKRAAEMLEADKAAGEFD